MKLGFIGMGNMASAIAIGALRAGCIKGSDITAYDPYPVKLEELAAEYGIAKASSAKEVANASDMIVLAVKPYFIEDVLEALGDSVCGKAVLSIALGWNFEKLSAKLPQDVRIQSVMPNTPMLVGEGVCIIEGETTFTPAESTFLEELFQSIGITKALPPRIMDAGGTLSGCGPAFVYMFIEALADGAVYHGLPRADAYTLAAQTVLGAAKMVLETGTHPGALKDNVCSPGGATIRGVAALEEGGFRASVINAIHEASND